MRQNRIYITGILLLIFLSGKAQRIKELPAVLLPIGCGESSYPCNGTCPDGYYSGKKQGLGKPCVPVSHYKRTLKVTITNDKKMYDMEEFLSKNGSVTILLFCFLLSLNIVFHILGFWKSYHEYSRKKEEGVRKGPDRCKEASMK